VTTLEVNDTTMDPATIGFGVASLLPLPVELFKQSIQAYKLFLEARNLEKTMVHFSLRLEIEYHSLVQWGNDCRLLPTPELHGAARQRTGAARQRMGVHSQPGKGALGSLKLHRGYSSNENSSLKQTSE
jgi:hypothetical protein